MAKKSKQELVRLLLNNSSVEADYDDLIEMLIDEPIAVNAFKEEKRTVGEKISDTLTKVAGSWSFIITFVAFLIIWIILNVTAFDNLDPYPFILLNLLLSCLAALQAPIIMMSQNREAKKESLKTANDYKTDLKSELILEELHEEMRTIIKNQKEIIKYIEEQKKDN